MGSLWGSNRKEFKEDKSEILMKEEVLKELRSPKLYTEGIIRYVEDNIEDAFNICCRKNLSINEKYPDSRYEGQLGQKTVFLTVRMFDLWETAVIEVLTSYLKKKFPSLKVKPVNDPIGDLLIVFPDGEEMRWEIKSSQAQDSFTGATHSASKCNNYILINYAIDKNLKLGNGGNGFITELAVFIWDKIETKWVGKPTEHSSFTTLRIPVEIKSKRPEIIVIGSITPKQKWCEINREKLSSKIKPKGLFRKFSNSFIRKTSS